MTSLPVISNWIAWHPRNGTTIKIGEDPIIGINNSFKLLVELISVLHEKGILFLNQALIDRVESVGRMN